jgi:hypothetical protein
VPTCTFTLLLIIHPAPGGPSKYIHLLAARKDHSQVFGGLSRRNALLSYADFSEDSA